VKEELYLLVVAILIEVVDSIGVECRGSSDKTVDLIAFAKK
jgi:hypothetical protein